MCYDTVTLLTFDKQSNGRRIINITAALPRFDYSGDLRGPLCTVMTREEFRENSFFII